MPRESHRGKSTASTMTREERTRYNCDRDTPIRATQLRNERRRLFPLFAVRTASLFAAFVSYERSSVDQLSLVRDFLSSVGRSIDPRPIDDIYPLDHAKTIHLPVCEDRFSRIRRQIGRKVEKVNGRLARRPEGSS